MLKRRTAVDVANSVVETLSAQPAIVTGDSTEVAHERTD